MISRFVIGFLALRPFHDGNDRMPHALTRLLLLKQGYDHVSYASLERIIRENAGAYVQHTSCAWRAILEDPSTCGPWLFFFLRVLRAQQDRGHALVDDERALVPLSDAQRRLVEFIGEHAHTTTAALAEQFGVPHRTIRFQLNALTRQGLIEAHGERRGRHYTLRRPPAV